MECAWGGTARWLGGCKIGGEPIDLLLAFYADDRKIAVLAQHARTGEPYAKVSVNVDGEPLGHDEFIVHHDTVESGFAKQILASCGGALLDTGRTASYGFVERMPIWRVPVASFEACIAVDMPS
jgi:hypothetical protein